MIIKKFTAKTEEEAVEFINEIKKADSKSEPNEFDFFTFISNTFSR